MGRREGIRMELVPCYSMVALRTHIKVLARITVATCHCQKKGKFDLHNFI